jgi:cytochrome c oxidase subunit 2
MNFVNKLLGIPDAAAAHALQIDHMLEVVHWFMLVLFIGWSLFFVYVLWRFNARRNPNASYHGVRSKASTHLEYGVVIIEALLLLGFAFPLWAKRVARDEKPDLASAVQIHAIAEQFGWNFVYPGPDGKFGTRRITLVDAANPVGLDLQDPAAADDIVAKNTMSLPNNVPAYIVLSSKDVIHNYAVKHFRIGQDAIPGMAIPIWFTPTKDGAYEIVCAQLCGTGHANMVGIVEVKPQAEHDAWIQSRLPAPAAPASAQATAAAANSFKPKS